jgi:hypothetical protein
MITHFNARVPALRDRFRRIAALANRRMPLSRQALSFIHVVWALFWSFNAFCASFFVLFVIKRRVCYAV